MSRNFSYFLSEKLDQYSRKGPGFGTPSAKNNTQHKTFYATQKATKKPSGTKLYLKPPMYDNLMSNTYSNSFIMTPPANKSTVE